MEIVTESIQESIMITLLVFVMMIWVDYFNVLTRGWLSNTLSKKKRQYVASSFLGVTLPCLGSFVNVSFYTHGLFTFGAVVGGFIATAGDEAFIMFSLFPLQALSLFLILFILGVASGWIVDRLAFLKPFQSEPACPDLTIHKDEETLRSITLLEVWHHLIKFSPARFFLFALMVVGLVSVWTGATAIEEGEFEKYLFTFILGSGLIICAVAKTHYIKDHIWFHIGKKHIWKIFLWTLGAFLLINLGLEYWHIENFVKNNMNFVFLTSCLIGLIPISGPHLIFVMLFAQGLVPFSVLLASTIVQDGHGLLPLLSYSRKDAVLAKLINFLLGLGIGGLAYLIGW